MARELKYSLFLLFQIICYVTSRTVSSQLKDMEQLPSCSEETFKSLKRGNAAFTGKFLLEAFKSKPNKNLIMSPFSVLVPIGELALYAEGNTYTQLMKTLNLQNKDEIRCTFPTLTSQLRAEKDVVLNMAAKIFATDKYPLTQSFLDDTKNVFDAEAESIDFDKPKPSAERINQWVESETNNRIKNIASPDMFDSDTRLVLANAIYYLGDWVYKFENSSTQKRKFHVNSKNTIRIPTMNQQAYFKYADVNSLDCKVLEMFYKGGNFSFVVFLPNQVEGLSRLIENLQVPESLYSAYDSTRKVKVNVYLPKISIDSEFNLGAILAKLGITDVFDKRSSKLDKILQVNEPLYVSTAKQKAFIEVDEKGTEAAAANIFVGAAITSIGAPLPRVYTFKADHPFAFYIMYKRDILFSGVFVNK